MKVTITSYSWFYYQSLALFFFRTRTVFDLKAVISYSPASCFADPFDFICSRFSFRLLSIIYCVNCILSGIGVIKSLVYRLLVFISLLVNILFYKFVYHKFRMIDGKSSPRKPIEKKQDSPNDFCSCFREKMK